uniref:MULE transposase domain-containing protein n=1 Tax=Panagrolaimus sp. PS1159 TaxID=55785 RepID=A0AC35FWY9_9BILA
MFLLFIDGFYSQPIEPATKTTQGRSLLTHDGYEYRFEKVSTADENLIFWRCNLKWCPGRLHENTATSTMTVKTKHKHPRSFTDIEVRASKEVKKELPKIPLPPQDLPPKIIYSMATQGLTGEALHTFHGADASMQTVHRMRYIPETPLVDEEDKNKIQITNFYTLDYSQNKFLLYDSRETDPTLSIFFIFASDNGVSRLRTHLEWAGDGTFYITPTNFMQTYILSAIVDGSALPCVYVVMSNKDAVTYERIFRVINQHVRASPERLMIDFEEAVIIASNNVWPHIRTSLCLFHLDQSIQKRVKDAHLSNFYQSNEMFRIDIRRTSALLALPKNLVQRDFDVLLKHAHNSANPPIIRNFGRTYIRTTTGQEPRFRIASWNMHVVFLYYLIIFSYFVIFNIFM